MIMRCKGCDQSVASSPCPCGVSLRSTFCQGSETLPLTELRLGNAGGQHGWHGWTRPMSGTPRDIAVSCFASLSEMRGKMASSSHALQ